MPPESIAAIRPPHPTQAAIFALCTVAVAQPVLDLVARYPAFLTAHHARWPTIAILLLTPCLLLPLLLVGVQAALSRLHRTAAYRFGLLVIGVLSALIVLRWDHDAHWLGTGSILALAIFGGWLSSTLFATRAWYRSGVRMLLIALLVIPGVFLLSPGVRDLLRHPQARAHPGSPGRTPPVILLVFDEFNSGALLTAEGKIDPLRFPNFARLTRHSSWYPAATAVSTETYTAIPALLSGRFPHGAVAPTASQYPDNLFSLLAPHYGMRVHETVTQLCQGKGCATASTNSAIAGTAGLLHDTGIIYAHLVWPYAWSSRLPPITRRWAAFGAADAMQARVHLALAEDQPARFRAFLAGIVKQPKAMLYYYHALLPHAPYHYLPSGQRYALDDGYAGIRFGNRWSGTADQVAKAHQRYRWQLQFVDRLLGELLDRLQALGILDQALLVVTADHGVSFHRGDWRRSLSPGNLRDILAIPLFIKWPGQSSAQVSNFPAQSTDILPSILAALAFDSGMKMDGISLRNNRVPPREAVVVFPRADHRLRIGLSMLHRSVRCQPFAETGAPHHAASTLIGRAVTPDLRDSAKKIALHIVHAERYQNVDPASAFLPVQLIGSVRRPDSLAKPAPLTLAIAVNGTIRTTTTATPSTQNGRQRFAALLPPSSLRPGANQIGIFPLHGDPPREDPTTRDESLYHLDVQRRAIVAPGGKRYTLTQGPEAGWIDGIDLNGDVPTLTGWSGDPDTPRPAGTVIAFSGGRYLGLARSGLPRSDVAAASGKAYLRNSGFALPAPVSALNACLRVFALSRTGTRATELAILPDVLLRGVLARASQ